MSYSLNVPVPGELKRLAGELHPQLVAFDRVRDRHTLVCKRLTDGDGADGRGGRGGRIGRSGQGAGGGRAGATSARLRERLRRVLTETPAFEARVDRIDFFETPTRGSGPVVYLAVESPGLVSLHRRLCETFPPVDGIEGESYVPHVTLARGGSLADAERLESTAVDPVEWTVSELRLWSGDYREAVARFRLPG
ncbi:2'-5' RNA ligase family protein [Halobium salinum]|uniref:2'-5' RNA ligase family protein n=1 Tax=Halobium salinum TaxID=1364940 RepID=A0ABD5PG99_9EURY|nr:2'-5' RNA ligase family protein [Halobium salinum]